MNFPELSLELNNYLEDTPDVMLLYACVYDKFSAGGYMHAKAILGACRRMMKSGYQVDIDMSSDKVECDFHDFLVTIE